MLNSLLVLVKLQLPTFILVAILNVVFKLNSHQLFSLHAEYSVCLNTLF